MSDPPEFSECVIYDRGDHVEIKWTAHGIRRQVLVAEELIDGIVERENKLRSLERRSRFSFLRRLGVSST